MSAVLANIPAIQGKYSLPKISDACIVWTAYKNPAGYGQVRVNHKAWLAHRYVYNQVFGNLSDNLVVMHMCDNPACINPGHLTVGTHADNVADKVSKGRGTAGELNGQAKLTAEQVQAIRDEYTGVWGQLSALGRKYSVNRSAIFKIVNNQHWNVK